MKITIEITPAKIGRRMKKWEMFISFLWFAAGKLQAPKKPQSPSTQTTAVVGACLRFGVWNFSGAWSLVFGAFSLRTFSRSLRQFTLALRHFGAFVTGHRFLRRDGHARTNALQAVDHDLFVGFQAG